MNKLAVYPGTFDPITFGHLDVVDRAVDLFGEVLIAVADSPEKKPLFGLEKRVSLIQQSVADKPKVRVVGFNNLLTEFLKDHHTNIVIRGLRAVSDFEYEFMLAGMNRKLMPTIETVYLMPSEQYMFVSSSFIREVARISGGFEPFVPEAVADALMALSSSD